MKKYEVLYCPIGVPTFHLESAEKMFNDSVELLKSINKDVIVPDNMLLSMEDLKSFIKDKNPDLVIIQNVTFANSSYSTEIYKTFDSQFILWTLREPVIDGGRLRLNSLTGAFSAGNAFYQMKDNNLLYMFGSPNEAEIQNRLSKIIKAAQVKHEMKGMNLLMIGHTPQGFGFGRALDLDMAKSFGVNLLAIESRELTNIAKSLKEEEASEAKQIADSKMVDLNKTNKRNRVDFYKLYQVYKDYIQKNNIKAIASRCWPDFFTDYGTPVCGVLGMLNDEKIAAACEADAYGALTMHIGNQFTEESGYFGDPVSLDENENTITFWHCGTSACSLARKDTGALTGVHPNRKIGPTMEFGLKPSKNATIFRIGRKPDGTFRFLLIKGEILDKPKQFFGTSMVVRVEQEVKPLITKLVKDGWEPHYVVLYGDAIEEIEILAEMLNIEVCKY
ncbi:fucose isomerase [Candidatus Izemoplasma sp. B36]|uniref:fucose isomerase n=1 Tax=Candidatus Izemoplasma sp. B36 TaxID=3242468 RepID=UPI0035577E68